MSQRAWLDPDGNFCFGKHEGEPLAQVRREDPSYLRWILGAVEDIADEDRALIEDCLARRAR